MTTLSLPSSAIRAVQFKLVSPTQSFRSPLSGSTQTFGLTGARWEAAYQLPPMQRATAAAWQAFLAKLAGRAGRFYGYDPAAPSPRGTIAGTPLVNGASQTGGDLDLDGITVGTTFLIGDHFAFDTSVGRELKIVTANATADGSGEMNVQFSPPIRISPADNAAIIIANPSCVMMLSGDDIGWDVDEALFYGVNFSAVEAIV